MSLYRLRSAEEIHSVTRDKRWRYEADNLLSINSFSPEFVKNFHSIWIQSGHHIREQIGDDSLLTKLLQHILPKYEGGDLVLYRGENLNRWEEKLIGYCWTPSIDIASMFGRGLNAVGKGGLLLSCNFRADWIISSPNEHSMYLGENQYTVNPHKISGINILDKYPPIF